MHDSTPVPLKGRIVTSQFYQYYEGRIFDNGALEFVFEPRFQNPVFTVWGNSILAGNSPSPIQPPQVIVSAASIVAGLGGLQAGGLYSQGLVNPDNAGNGFDSVGY